MPISYYAVLIILALLIGGWVYFKTYHHEHKISSPAIKADISHLGETYRLECKALGDKYRKLLKTTRPSARKELQAQFLVEKKALKEKQEADIENLKSEKSVGVNEGLSLIPDEECMVQDNNTGCFGYVTISGASLEKIRKENGSLGRKWVDEWDGSHKVYELCKYEDKGEIKLKPIYPTVRLDTPPSYLRGALSHPYTNFTWNVKLLDSFFGKFGGVLIFAGVALFLMFMLVADK